MQSFQSAKAEDEAFTKGYMQLWESCKEECERIPHVALGRDPHSNYLGPVSTANAQYLYMARRDVSALDEGRLHIDPLPGLQEHERLMREIVRAADKRDAAVQRVRDRYEMDAADERSEALTERFLEARDTLMDMPAPDLAALRWKLEQLPENDGDLAPWTGAFVRQTFADVARLLPPAA
jgi:hypothetical protein